jgi:dehydrogenase/reductase SDR family member 12
MSSARTVFARVTDAAMEATVAPSFSRIGHAVRSRLERWENPAGLDGVGRRVLVTGVNSGLGYAVAAMVLRAGGHVIGTVRSEAKGAATRTRLAEDLGESHVQRLDLEVADLEDLASVRALADRCVGGHPPLDAIVHNAGAMFAEHATTDDGLERTYQVHVVAPFLLTARLLPHLREGARVVTVTSGGMYAQALDVDRLTNDRGAGDPGADHPGADHPGADDASRRPYRGSVAYALAKRAQVVLTSEWARRASDAGVTFHAVHPGWALTPGVESSLPTFRRITGPILRSPEEGADTIVWLALASEVLENGGLWHDRRRRTTHRVPWTRRSPSEPRRLWQRVASDAGVDPADPAVRVAEVDATDAATTASVTPPRGRPARPGRPAGQHR